MTYYLWHIDLLDSNLSSYSTNVTFLIQDSIQVLQLLFNYVLLVSPIWNKSPVFDFHDLGTHEEYCPDIFRISLNLVYHVFSWLDWNKIFLARIFQKWCDLSASYSASYQGVHDTKELHQWWLLLWYLVKVMYTRLIKYRFIISPFLIISLLSGGTLKQWKIPCFYLYYCLLVLVSIDESFFFFFNWQPGWAPGALCLLWFLGKGLQSWRTASGFLKKGKSLYCPKTIPP